MLDPVLPRGDPVGPQARLVEGPGEPGLLELIVLAGGESHPSGATWSAIA